jgi:putative transposase
MPRRARSVINGYPHHVVNRGNDRRRLFYTDADYLRLLRLMVVGKSRYPVKIYGLGIMPNHFHWMVAPEADGALAGYLRWVSGSYASDLRARTNTVGYGHVFQRRYWSDAILEYDHCLSVLRYIEGNPFRDGLVSRAEDWPWTSIAWRLRAPDGLLDPLPFELPRDWLTIVNVPQPPKEIERIRRALRKQRRGETVPRGPTPDPWQLMR